MALETGVTVRGKRLDKAYMRVEKIHELRVDAPIRATVYIYANGQDRKHERSPEETFEIEVPYSEQPFAAVYGALKRLYPDNKDA